MKEIKTTTVQHNEEPVVQTTTQEVSPIQQRREIQQKKKIFRYYQIVWYICGFIEAILAIRFVFKLLGANPFTPLVSLIYSISDPLIYPFQGIFRTPMAYTYVFETETLIALVIYPLVASGIVALLKLIKPVNEQEVEQQMDSI